MNAILKAEILDLPLSERLQLVEDIWDSIAENPNQVSLTQSQKTELDVRLERHRKNPDEGSSWNDVRSRILNRS